MTDLQGKSAIVTGASSGIGAATARQLAGKGVKVVLAARREDRLDELKKEIEQAGGEAIVVATDVTDRKQVEALAKRTVEAFGAVDILVNNAGLMPLSFMRKLHVGEWETMVDVNVKGVLYGIAAVLDGMRERNAGHIVNVSSVAGRRLFPGGAVYCGTKFAVRAISEGLRSELANEGSNVRVTTIEPGAVATELTETITDKDVMKYFEKMGDMRRLDSEDIARAIVYAVAEPGHVDIAEMLIMPRQQG